MMTVLRKADPMVVQMVQWTVALWVAQRVGLKVVQMAPWTVA
jgi:hypothetical protein